MHPSSFFTKSNKFSESNNFTPSETLIEKSVVIINIQSDKTNKISVGMKVGIGIASGILGIALIFIGLFLLIRKKRINIPDLEEETIEIAENTNASIYIQNPLTNIISDDDPFMNDFE